MKASELQVLAEVQCAPSPKKKLNQHQRIIQVLEQNGGFVTPMGCIHRCPVVTTKLATRIGEIERRTGITFERSRVTASRFTKYTTTKENLEKLKEFYKLNSNGTDN